MISLVRRLGGAARNAGRTAVAAAAVNLVCGLLIVCFSSAHLIAVTVRRVHLKIPAWVSGEPHAVIAGVPYDFRIYSLLLFGSVILAGGMISIRASLGIARGDSDARRRSARAMIMVLATVVPVMPMQDAAPILIVPAAASLAATLSKGKSKVKGQKSKVWSATGTLAAGGHTLLPPAHTPGKSTLH
jgi:hypothetical protein